MNRVYTIDQWYGIYLNFTPVRQVLEFWGLTKTTKKHVSPLVENVTCQIFSVQARVALLVACQLVVEKSQVYLIPFVMHLCLVFNKGQTPPSPICFFVIHEQPLTRKAKSLFYKIHDQAKHRQIKVAIQDSSTRGIMNPCILSQNLNKAENCLYLSSICHQISNKA